MGSISESRRGEERSGPPCWKITSCYIPCFLSNTGMDPLEKQLDPKGPIVSRGDSYGRL